MKYDYLSSSPAQVQIVELALASHAGAGHYDELRGGTTSDAGSISSNQSVSDSGVDTFVNPWSEFFSLVPGVGVKELDDRAASLSRQIRDNGVSYNVYADESGPQRPWSLGLFPLIIDASSWQKIEAGVQQRMRLLEKVMTDVYGPQNLLTLGLLPPALVLGHPGYLRPMHGVAPVGGIHLHIAALDLARGPDGNWWVVSQRLQAPSGLGYLLENRLAISSQFPDAFQAMQVQRLAGTYRALIENLKKRSPAGAQSHLALLTPGPYNETYFEHAYLARYLGLTLVEGSDLLVRDEHLFLKTLKGLVPVHGLLKRLDDQYLDPLELRPDSTLGVPGLLQAIRAGNVLIANTPGSAFLESPAMLGFLPALSNHLLNEDLLLPAVPTWWCGEKTAMDKALPQLKDLTIKPTYPGSVEPNKSDAVVGRTLTSAELDKWSGQISLHGGNYTAQAFLPMSQIPTWQPSTPASEASPQSGRVVPRSVMLRVFAVTDQNGGYRILPGGMARVAGSGSDLTSMQRGGSSADVWTLTHGKVDQTSLLQPPLTPEALTRRERLITSRAAENLFWLGRYSERAENAIRLARLVLESLRGEHQTIAPLLKWIGTLSVANTLIAPGGPDPRENRRAFERAIIASLGDTQGVTSVGYYMRALKMTAFGVRERLSQAHWRMIVRAEEKLLIRCAEQVSASNFSSLTALNILRNTSDHMAAITGAQTDRMTRDDGWRLLSIGRLLERLNFLATALARGFDTGSIHTDGGFEAIVELFDCTITFRAQFQQSHDLVALIDLLVLDPDNPRSLAWITHTIRGRLAKLAGCGANEVSRLSNLIPDPATWDLRTLCQSQPNQIDNDTQSPSGVGIYFALNELLLGCIAAALKASDEISATYFTHARASNYSLGNS